MSQKIYVQRAKTHNLKNISLHIPRDQLVVITGLSGSGKSSLAFDTLYAEGQRRYVESLSTYARQFLSMMEKPDVELIEGLSPAIAIEQKSISHNPRSTVGTITEIYDYLRLLFARAGTPFCPEHQVALKAQTISQIVDHIIALPKDLKVMLIAPVIQGKKGDHSTTLDELRQKGFVRIRLNGQVRPLDYSIQFDPKLKHDLDVVVDRLKINPQQSERLAESIETAVSLSGGLVVIQAMDDDDQEPITFSTQQACPKCGFSTPTLEPKLFSFNNPYGACSSCDGLGTRRYFSADKMIIDPTLSISEGAIFHWNPKHKYYYALLNSVADFYGFSLDTPWNELKSEHQEVLLNGTPKRIPLRYANLKGRPLERMKRFEGILPNTQRRYEETESEAIREELKPYLTFDACPDCEGTRLNTTARCVRVGPHHLKDIIEVDVSEAQRMMQDLTLDGIYQDIAAPIIKELTNRLGFLMSVGLNYLTLHRQAETLSGGEGQRIRLASQIGSGLVGVMYILDEPSIGLHQRDNQRLIDTLIHLRDLGNTIIVVEHDEDTIRQADHVIDIGPGAGVHGGEVIAEGSPQDIIQHTSSLTGDYLSGRKKVAEPNPVAPNPDRWLSLTQVCTNNLKNIDVALPIGLMTVVSGVSGSGKSSLVRDTLLPAVFNHLTRGAKQQEGQYNSIHGLEYIEQLVAIDQSPIGRTPRSNPATYTGLFTPIRDLFSQTAQARAKGFKPGRFSFNVPGGRCEACHGDGVIRVEMHFLADLYVTCDQCEGKRYNRETLNIQYKGKNIAEVLNMTVAEALSFFEKVPVLARKLQTLMDVGLSYIHLGQSATTLSGGEAQRIKLSKELSKRSQGKTLYILDEPTTGLHFHDIKQLLHVLHRLRDQGNTLVIIEHNIDVIKTADWIIDIGPEGGKYGGELIVSGPPKTVSKNKKSHTAPYLIS
ncbi:MAG: excinuclease ABC subunit UvrA [Candidatus Comchoanobacterales bacterium]